MIGVTLQSNENIDRALKRFKKKYERSGILREFKKRTAFMKPSIENRLSRLKAARRQHRATMEQEQIFALIAYIFLPVYLYIRAFFVFDQFCLYKKTSDDMIIIGCCFVLFIHSMTKRSSYNIICIMLYRRNNGKTRDQVLLSMFYNLVQRLDQSAERAKTERSFHKFHHFSNL